MCAVWSSITAVILQAIPPFSKLAAEFKNVVVGTNNKKKCRTCQDPKKYDDYCISLNRLSHRRFLRDPPGRGAPCSYADAAAGGHAAGFGRFFQPGSAGASAGVADWRAAGVVGSFSLGPESIHATGRGIGRGHLLRDSRYGIASSRVCGHTAHSRASGAARPGEFFRAQLIPAGMSVASRFPQPNLGGPEHGTDR